MRYVRYQPVKNEEPPPPAKKDQGKAPSYRGLVFGTAGKTVALRKGTKDRVAMGARAVFLDTRGRLEATGHVVRVFHAKILVKLASGKTKAGPRSPVSVDRRRADFFQSGNFGRAQVCANGQGLLALHVLDRPVGVRRPRRPYFSHNMLQKTTRFLVISIRRRKPSLRFLA